MIRMLVAVLVCFCWGEGGLSRVFRCVQGFRHVGGFLGKTKLESPQPFHPPPYTPNPASSKPPP